MKNAWLLFAVLWAAPARADRMICDVSQTMVGEARRSQNSIGACHAFAAVSLIEAAIYRQHREKIALSEADVFIVATVARQSFLDQLVARHKAKNYRPLSEGDFPEGVSIDDDLATIMLFGVAKRSTVPYPEFDANYVDYRRYMVKQLQELERKIYLQSYPDRQKAVNAIDAVYQNHKVAVDVTSLLLKLHGVPAPSPRDLETFANSVIVYLKAQELAAGYWSRKSASQKETEAKFLGPDKVAAVEKERVEIRSRYRLDKLRRKKVSSFTKKGYPPGPDSTTTVAAWAVRQLCERGRPVGLGLDLRGLPEWQKDGKFPPDSPAEHEIVLTGVREDPAGNRFFVVRNSWGLLQNHDIAVATLAKTPAEAVTVLIPGEPD